MRFFRNWLNARAQKARNWEPATGAKFRANVARESIRQLPEHKADLTKMLHRHPPEHANHLRFRLDKLTEHALRVAMINWHAGDDPRAHLFEIPKAVEQALAVRPDVLLGKSNYSIAPVVCGMLGLDFPFASEPPAPEEVSSPVLYLERWMVAGLSDPSSWAKMKTAPKVKNQLIQKTLNDYWALLTDQIAPETGIKSCIANFDRRASHPTFKAGIPHLGGGQYNEFSVDYILAAILDRRSIKSNSVHDYIWNESARS